MTPDKMPRPVAAEEVSQVGDFLRTLRKMPDDNPTRLLCERIYSLVQSRNDEIAGLRAQVEALRVSLIRACNAADGRCDANVSNEKLGNVGAQVEGCIAKLRSDLAAAYYTG